MVPVKVSVLVLLGASGVGNAVRKSLTSESLSGSAEQNQNLFDKVKVLLEEHLKHNTGNARTQTSLESLLQTQHTPGVADTFNELSAQIKNSKAIETRFDTTQKAVKDIVDLLVAQQKIVVSAGNTFMTSQSTASKCVGEETQLLTDCIDAATTRTENDEDKVEKCNNAQLARDLEYTRPEELDTFTCDVETSNDECQTEWKGFTDKVDAAKLAIDEQVTGHTNTFATLAGNCVTATKTLADQVIVLEDTEAAYRQRNLDCHKQLDQSRSDFCAFGDSAKNKCSTYTSYNDIVGQVGADDHNDHSSKDRESETLLMHTVDCTLQGLEGQELTECVAALPLASVVDVFTSEVRSSVDITTVKCGDTATFRFDSSTTPTGTIDEISIDLKDEYSETNVVQTFLKLDSPPFAMCA